MSVTSWFRQIFSPGAGTGSSETNEPASVGMPGAPGVSGFAEIETAEAVEGVEGSTEAPSDPA